MLKRILWDNKGDCVNCSCCSLSNCPVLGVLLLQQSTLTKEIIGEERVYSATIFITSGTQDRNSSRTGTWRQELVQKSWRGASYWLAPMTCSAYLLIEPKTTSPGLALPTTGRAIPHCSLVKKMPYNWTSWRNFLSWGSFLSSDSNLCEDDTQNQLVHTVFWTLCLHLTL